MVLGASCVPAVVLIVEDEMMIRMRAVDMVEDAGYTAVEALDADEAVAILESRSDVALMCTDIQMPGSMDGVGIAHAVHARWPSIKIMVVSGQLNPAEHRPSSLQQVFRQATRSRADDCPEPEHEWPGLTLIVLRRIPQSRLIASGPRKIKCVRQLIVIQLGMPEDDFRTVQRLGSGAEPRGRSGGGE